MFRRTRVILAAFLTLAVVLCGVGSSGIAAAQTTGDTIGDWVSPTIAAEAFAGVLPAGQGSFKCSAQFRLDSSNVADMGDLGMIGDLYVGNGYCRGGTDISPFFCQIGEADCTQTMLSVKSESAGGGTVCDDRVMGPFGSYQGAGDSIGHTVYEFAVTPEGFGWNMDCDPSEVCIDLWVGALHAKGCAALPIDLSPEPEEPGSCAYMTGVERPQITSPIQWGQAPFDYWGWHQTLAAHVGSVSPTMGGARFYVVHSAEFGTTLPDTTLGTLRWFSNNFVGTNATGQVNYSADGDSLTENRPNLGGSIVGFGIVGWQVPNDETVIQGTPQNRTGGLVGVTDPGKCAWYWGTKIALIEADDRDEPVGDLPPEGGTDPVDPGDPPISNPEDPAYDPDGDGTPNPEDPDQDPDDDEPTDEVGWLKLLFQLLGQLLQAIGALASAVAGLVASLIGALLDLLKTLFIPDPSSWGSDGVMTQMEDAGPTNAIGEVSSGVGSTVTTYRNTGDGCGNLFTTVIGTETTSASTCDTSPMLVGLRQVVAAGLVVVTGIGIVRMLGRVLES